MRKSCFVVLAKRTFQEGHVQECNNKSARINKPGANTSQQHYVLVLVHAHCDHFLLYSCRMNHFLLIPNRLVHAHCPTLVRFAPFGAPQPKGCKLKQELNNQNKHSWLFSLHFCINPRPYFWWTNHWLIWRLTIIVSISLFFFAIQCLNPMPEE